MHKTFHVLEVYSYHITGLEGVSFSCEKSNQSANSHWVLDQKSGLANFLSIDGTSMGAAFIGAKAKVNT